MPIKVLLAQEVQTFVEIELSRLPQNGQSCIVFNEACFEKIY